MGNPFKGKPTSKGGKFELPSEDIHNARVVALIDLGTQLESYNGGAEKEKRQVLLAFELDEKNSENQNHVVAQKYTMSFHVKSTLLSLAEVLINDGKQFPLDDEKFTLDYTNLLGAACQVQISHDKKGERIYHKIAAISALPRKQREACFKPERKPVMWSIDDDIDDVPTWLPYVFGEPATDIIKRSLEMQGGSKVGHDEGEVGAAGDDNTPF